MRPLGRFPSIWIRRAAVGSRFWILVGTLAAAPVGVLTSVAVAQEQTRDAPTRLIGLLALTPDTPEIRRASWGVGYADWAAFRLVTGLGAPASRADFEAMSQAERASWLASLARIQSGPPELLQYAPEMIERMPELLGFGWFDVRAGLAFGEPPEVGTVLAVDDEPAGLPGILAAREFEATEYDGVTLWVRQPDGAFDFDRREPADPFVGTMGFSVRIAVTPGHVINGRFLATAQAMIGAAQARAPSLADAQEYRALAEVLSEIFEGGLLQAMFFDPAVVGLGYLDPTKPPPAQDGSSPPGTGLPAYRLAALGDGQDGEYAVHAIALFYTDHATAEMAAAELDTRLRGQPETRSRDARGIVFDEPRALPFSGGGWVAVASVRYLHPVGFEPGAEVSAAVFADTLYAAWLNGLAGRTFTALYFGAGE